MERTPGPERGTRYSRDHSTSHPAHDNSRDQLLPRIPAQKFTDVLEPFCNGPKTEVALINAVQVYSYEDTRIIKAFPQILKARDYMRRLFVCLC